MFPAMGHEQKSAKTFYSHLVTREHAKNQKGTKKLGLFCRVEAKFMLL